MQFVRPTAALSLFALLALTTGLGVGCGDDGDDAECLALPVCLGTDQEVDSCPAGISCYEQSTCGTTILCEPVGDQCLAEPTCQPGFDQVESCDETSADCELVTECGSAVYCKKAPCNSGCDAGDITASPCPAGGTCYESNSCGGGQVMSCLDVESCGVVCDEGDTEADCDPTQPGCYEVTGCDDYVIVTCEDVGLPEHGCPAEDPDGESCTVADAECNYDSGNDCFDTYLCQDMGEGLTWTWAGAGCAGD